LDERATAAAVETVTFHLHLHCAHSLCPRVYQDITPQPNSVASNAARFCGGICSRLSLVWSRGVLLDGLVRQRAVRHGCRGMRRLEGRAGPGFDIASELERPNKMKREGLITDAEYARNPRRGVGQVVGILAASRMPTRSALEIPQTAGCCGDPRAGCQTPLQRPGDRRNVVQSAMVHAWAIKISHR